MRYKKSLLSTTRHIQLLKFDCSTTMLLCRIYVTVNNNTYHHLNVDIFVRL